MALAPEPVCLTLVILIAASGQEQFWSLRWVRRSRLPVHIPLVHHHLVLDPVEALFLAGNRRGSRGVGESALALVEPGIAVSASLGLP